MVFSNKKGQAVFDLVLLVIVVFVVALAALFGGFIYNELDTEMQSDTDFSSEAKAVSATINSSYSVWFDNVIFSIVIFLWISLLITSFMIDTNPIFFIITLMFMIVVFIAGMAISNAWEDISQEDELSSYAQNFSKTNFIFDNFLIVLIIIGFTTALSLYAKGGGL